MDLVCHNFFFLAQLDVKIFSAELTLAHLIRVMQQRQKVI